MIEILTFVFFLLILFEVASHIVYGKILSDNDVIDYINKFENFEKNFINPNIISPKIDYLEMDREKFIEHINDSRFISLVRLTLSTKYYINNFGRVQRWSKGHYMIKNLYKKLKN
jgi:hypothetical protein